MRRNRGNLNSIKRDICERNEDEKKERDEMEISNYFYVLTFILGGFKYVRNQWICPSFTTNNESRQRRR